METRTVLANRPQLLAIRRKYFRQLPRVDEWRAREVWYLLREARNGPHAEYERALEAASANYGDDLEALAVAQPSEIVRELIFLNPNLPDYVRQAFDDCQFARAEVAADPRVRGPLLDRLLDDGQPYVRECALRNPNYRGE